MISITLFYPGLGLALSVALVWAVTEFLNSLIITNIYLCIHFSHCPEHTWKLRSEVFTPGKKSVFYANPQLSQGTQREEDEGASDSEQEQTKTSPQEAQGSRAELREKVDKAESAMLQEPSSLRTKTAENDGHKTVGLTGDTMLLHCQESHHASIAIKSSTGIVLKSDDDPDGLNHDRESCFPESCSDNNDRRSSWAESPDSDCYESCEGQSDDHEISPLNCDKNDSRDLLNCTSSVFSCDRPTHGTDFQNLTTDIPSCLRPSYIKRKTLFDNQKSLQNFHKLSLYQESTDDSSPDAM